MAMNVTLRYVILFYQRVQQCADSARLPEREVCRSRLTFRTAPRRVMNEGAYPSQDPARYHGRDPWLLIMKEQMSASRMVRHDSGRISHLFLIDS